MTPLTIAFTPDAAELARIRRAFTEKRAVRTRRLAIAYSVLLLVQGLVNANMLSHYAELHWLALVQIAVGIVYAPLILAIQQAHFLQARASTLSELTIDDAGITVADPPTHIPWKKIIAIRDVGEAFIAVRMYGKAIPILKRALPDGGGDLWAALDEKLTASRYLVRGTDSRLTISNTASS